MSRPPLKPAVPYRDDVERPEDDEAATTAELIETLRGIADTVERDEGHAHRSVHAKSHGLLVGELRVADGLPTELRQGLFARHATYPVVLRFSSVPGDLLDDSVSLPRGLSIKIIGVDGERLPGDADVTQDFVMVNGPVFAKPDAKSFLKNLKLLAKTTDKAEPMKKALSAVLRGTEKIIEAFGGESATLKALGGHPETHVLGETYFTQVPLRHGDYIAKYSIAPVSSELTSLKDAPVEVNGKPNGLRDALVRHFAQGGGDWELRVQLCRDLETMPIEDASKEWSQDDSPFVPVARLRVAPQVGWSEERSRIIDDGLSFSPWHALAAHRPLGSIMRVRRVVYDTMSKARAARNGVTIDEPVSLESLGLDDTPTVFAPD